MVLVLDTDPGVDDMLALLLLLATPLKEAELRMITLTYGNCSLQDTLNNTLSLFNVVDKENKWRKSKGLHAFTDQKPYVYLGSSRSLTGAELPEEQELHALDESNDVDATDVHGSDGLAGIHESHPEFDAPAEWFEYFKADKQEQHEDLPFRPGGSKPAWQAILELLKSEPANTVTLIAVGPLTNLAKAAAIDPQTFLKAKEVLSMGGALRNPGNVTPLAEFNVFTDPLASAHIYGLTSENPRVVMPPTTPENLVNHGSTSPLNLVIFALDITMQHDLFKADVEEEIGGALKRYPDSVLAKWVYSWLMQSFVNYGKLVGVGPDNARCRLHDPLTAAYALAEDRTGWTIETEDVRVETEGQWAAGQTIVDNRGRVKSKHNPHDLQKWLTLGEGNRVQVVCDTPIKKTFNKILMKKIVGI